MNGSAAAAPLENAQKGTNNKLTSAEASPKGTLACSGMVEVVRTSVWRSLLSVVYSLPYL